jgi:hypothetical protein
MTLSRDAGRWLAASRNLRFLYAVGQNGETATDSFLDHWIVPISAVSVAS